MLPTCQSQRAPSLLLSLGLLWACGGEPAKGKQPPNPDGGAEGGGMDAGAEDGAVEPDAESPEPEEAGVDAWVPPPLVPGDPCDLPTACEDGRVCVDGICMLDPSGRSYVEDSFRLLRPAPLQMLFDTAASDLAGDTRFFATIFPDAPQDGTFEVPYSAARPDPDRDDGYVFQGVTGGDMSFVLQRLVSKEQPDQGNAWQSAPFDYRLSAHLPTLGVYLRFDSIQTIATLQFDDSLALVESGTLRGALTAERAATLPLEVPCPLACPLTCLVGPKPALSTLLDALDCNALAPDLDLDPSIDGNDAYTVELAFTAVEAPVRMP